MFFNQPIITAIGILVAIIYLIVYWSGRSKIKDRIRYTAQKVTSFRKATTTLEDDLYEAIEAERMRKERMSTRKLSWTSVAGNMMSDVIVHLSKKGKSLSAIRREALQLQEDIAYMISNVQIYTTFPFMHEYDYRALSNYQYELYSIEERVKRILTTTNNKEV